MAVADLVQELTGKAPPTALLTAWESMLSEADPCLVNYSAAQQDLVKAYAIAHFMTQQGGGEIQSDKSPTGASVTYGEWMGQGTGLDSTRFGAQLLGLPGGDCIAAVIDKPKRFARSLNGWSNRGLY